MKAKLFSLTKQTFLKVNSAKSTVMNKSTLTLIDGSMGTCLIDIGLPHGEGSMFKQLWSAAALADDKFHDLIVQAHMEYIKVGSQTITTNSYATQPNYYEETYGKDKYEGQMLKHAKISAELAVKARQNSVTAKDVKIFGSLGAICESHQPGITRKYIENRGKQFCIETYCKLAKALYDGGVEGYQLETMNNWEEAVTALEGIKLFKQEFETPPHLPINLSFEGALRNDQLQPAPDQLAKIFKEKFLNYFDENPNLGINCFGLNCASLEDIINSLNCLFSNGKDELDFEKELKKRNLGFSVYANLEDRDFADEKGYDRYNDDVENTKLRTDLVGDKHHGYCSAIETIVKDFKAVTHIGGCCGCGPEGIESLAKRLF